MLRHVSSALARRITRPALGMLFWTIFAAGVLAHGAWLGGGGVALTDASKQQIQDNVAAGLPPLSVGDTLSVIADFPVIVDGTVDGPGGYATLYVPDGTEVVGAYITDATGTPVPARPARASTGSGVSKGWGPKGQQVFDISPNGWAPADTTQCEAAGFSIANCNAGLAYIYGDTGIFYSTRADTALYADGSSIATLENGYLVNPTNNKPWATVGGTGTARVHNKWDAVQVNAFGSNGNIDPNGFTTSEETTITGGRGATPFRAGSPVAGPESGTDWDRYGVTGPWNRISYAGSCRADDPLLAGPDGPATGAGSVFPEALDPGVNTVEVCTETTEGYALNDSAAVALPSGTNAVRYAFGGIAQGEVYYAVMDVRITDLAALGTFNAEGHGGDSAEGAAAGNDNPWRYWVAGTSSLSPAGPDDLHIDIAISAVNGAPYGGGDIPQGATVTYRVSYVNTSLSQMTNVATQATLPAQISGTGNFQVVTGDDIRPASDPVSGTFSFATLPVLGGLGSGAIEFDAYVTATTGGTLTASASNSSDQGGADADSVTTNVSGTPVDTMPVCNGSRFTAVDWNTDAPVSFGVANSFARYGITTQVLATDAGSALRPAQIGTTGALYASTYGGSPVLTQQYATLDVSFDTPVSAVQFYIASLDLDESVTVYGELAGQRVQPNIANGPLATGMLRAANADGSVLAERDSGFSNATLAETSAVLVGFGGLVDRIVISHTTRQFNSANVAGAMQLTDIQACADFTDAPSALGDTLHARSPNGSYMLGPVVTGDTGPGNASDAGSDDDDGVEIPPLVQGFLATLEATVTGSGGLLSGWMDFNGDSVFEPGTAEEIAVDLSDDGLGADQVAGDGLIQFEVVVPGDAVLDQTFARFRWSTVSNIGVTPPAPNGEVEDYAINIAAAPLVDRGDAPASYGDPLHIIADVAVAGTYLGAISPDPEAAPQTSADATGDDLDGNDDEDGVTMPQLYAGGTAEITVVVNEVSGGVGSATGAIAYLQAWIDFDGDGSFDAADQIATNLQDGSAGDKDGTLNGIIKFDVNVPVTSTLAPTYARFRWSTTEGVVPVALDGEIEDYLTTISNDDPPVTCDNGLYQITSNRSELKRMRFSDGGGVYALTFDALGTSASKRLDAGWGYNALDGYIYGVPDNKHELWRIDGGGNFLRLPDIPASAQHGGLAGDILSDGTMVYQADDTTWQLLDLTDPSNVVDLGVLTLSQALPVGDFAAHPFDGFLYGINPSTSRAFRVSSNGGLAGPVAVLEFGDPIHTGTYAAVFFDEDGRFYAYDSVARELFLINTTTGARQLLARATTSEGGLNDGASCRGPAPVALSGFGGNIFADLNASDIKDGAETNLGAGIRVDLYSDNGTPNDLSDDGSVIASVDTATDGTYRFEGLPSGVTYRVEVDVNDPDLPAGAQIGTSNPLVGVTTDSATVVVDRDFGFDPQSSDLSISKRAYRAGTATEITSGAAGDLIDWVIEITNDGPGSPSGVRVIERIPDGYDYISDTAPTTGDFYDPGTGLWFVDEILSGATETITIRVRMRDSGNFTNHAEVTESSLPDLDSDPSAGPLVDDYDDGISDDDEASVTLTLDTGTRLLSGRIIHDNGEAGGTAHDGTATGGEVGTNAGTIDLRDEVGTLIARPSVGADGRWSYALDANYVGEVTLSLTPDDGWLAISEDSGAAPAVVNADPHDGSYSFTPAPGTDHIGLNVGVISSPTLSEDRSANMTAGQVILLPHLYRASSSGTLSVAYADVTEPTAGAFSIAIFHDTDCDTVPDAPLNDPLTVSAGQEICLISRVSSGGGVPESGVLSYRIVATTAFTGTTVTHALSNQDRVTVGSAGGELIMVKTVRNETRGTAEGQSNSAAPGDVLAYRITLINPSRTNATQIMIYDRTPPYTQLSEPVATPVVVSPALSCDLATPVTNVAGYAGPLQWDCAGFHAPGDEGSVIFKVQVTP